MARFTGGWFKSYREAWEKDLSQNVFLWGIWNALLHMATYKETQIIWGNDQRRLPPGSIVFGIKRLADQWDCSPRTISKWLHYLEKCERIVIESCARGTVVTICNWSSYQITEEQACAIDAHSVRAACAPTARLVALSEEGKKEEGKKERKKREASPLPPLALIWNELSFKTLPKVKDIDPKGKRGRAAASRWVSNSDMDYWRSVIDKINQSDFCKGANDRGWKANFDWLIQIDTAVKILEGKYDGKETNSKLEDGYFDFLKKEVSA